MPHAPTAGYSGKPLAAKLGFKPGPRVLVRHAPAHYADLVAPLPDGVTFPKKLPADFAHVFVTDRKKLAAELRELTSAAEPPAAIWISWPKKSSGVATDVTEDSVRAETLPLGWVDIKVCAVDATWSALKLAKRRPQKV